MSKNIIIYFILFFTIVACDENNSSATPIDSHEPIIELQFTSPPIDLQNMDVLFSADIPYDEYNNTTFDIFLPASAFKTGLVIFIHGGGFIGGDKSFIYSESNSEKIIELLNNGIAVATINYRLIMPGDDEGVLKSLTDSKRALQYIRYIHNELNINKEDIVLYGSSAGASTALWLATNDDLKDINSTDLVLQESTRVKGIALNATQSSLDIEGRWIEDVFVDFETSFEDIIQEYGTQRIYNLYGANNIEEYNTPETQAYREQVDMLSLLSSDDPEIWIRNTSVVNTTPQTTGSYNHHSFHAREIKEYAEMVGITVIAIYGNPILYNNSNNESFIQFLIRKINE